MHNVVMLVFVVLAFSVAVVNWARIREPDVLLPSIAIALVGGIANVLSTAYVQRFSPGWITYVYVVGFLLLVTLAGLYLADRAGLPGLWAGERVQGKNSEDGAKGHGGTIAERLLAVGAGALIGLGVGLGLWRVGLREAPGMPGFLQIVKAFEGPKAALCMSLLVIQSGFVEEPMYRLFALSAISKGLSSCGVNRRARTVVAVLGSSLVFGLIPTHNFLVSSLVGLLFGTAYLCLGLVPLIIAHCVTNAVQFPLLLGWWR